MWLIKALQRTINAWQNATPMTIPTHVAHMSQKSLHTGINLQTLASELRNIADQIEKGTLEVEGTAVPMGKPLFLKTKQKIKEDRAYFTLSLKVALKIRPPSPRVPAKATDNAQVAIGRRKEETPAGSKALKKEIARLWKEIAGQIGEGTPPDAAAAGRLLRACEDYRLYTDSSWSQDWQDCQAAIHRCLDTAAGGDLTAARALIAAVNQQTKSCHKLYK